MSVQLYGQFDRGSFATVSRAIARALKRATIDATIYAYGSYAPRYIDVPFAVAMNSRADCGIFVGYPQEALGWLEGHNHRVLVTVCESSPVPYEWAEIANKMSLVAVPSKFCLDTFIKSGVKVPIIVAPHGVSSSLLLAHGGSSPGTGANSCHAQTGVKPNDKTAGRDDASVATRVRLLHVSEAGSFPWRKGTAQLITAFRRVSKHFPNVELYIKSDSLQLDKVLRGSDRIYPLHTHRPTMAGLYRAFDAVVQPSRGEGFGMVPLEARCLGVPAVLTETSGHLQHLAKGVDVVIPVGPMQYMKTQGNSIGNSPTVKVDDVEHALFTLLKNLDAHKARTQAWAHANAGKWTWNRVLSPLVRQVANLGGMSRLYDLSEEHGQRGF